MFIATVKNKQEFNDFVASRQYSQFLQSYDWAEFQERLGNRVLPLLVADDTGRTTASALFIKKRIPALNQYYWYCPRGPVMDDSTHHKECYSALLDHLRRIAGREKIVFSRWDPLTPLSDNEFKPIKTIDIQPPRTILLDLSLDEEELLVGMHQKTRYNIRLASRKGVKVREAGAEEFDKFWGLMEATADRDGFRLHGRDHYQEMLEAAPRIFRLFLAEYENRVIAGNIVAFFGDTVTYVHGASDHEYRRVMAPYALQWKVISLAKDQNFRYYDLYGIDENKWPGVTRFKRGFGGKEVQYPGTYDIVFSDFWYKIYRGGRWLRRKRN
jgi:lipid II:glycine glycyltransferase (peptidoglycan interpeptide bridge formation enzyme)